VRSRGTRRLCSRCKKAPFDPQAVTREGVEFLAETSRVVDLPPLRAHEFGTMTLAPNKDLNHLPTKRPSGALFPRALGGPPAFEDHDWNSPSGGLPPRCDTVLGLTLVCLLL
jgi:hypothetical protein